MSVNIFRKPSSTALTNAVPERQSRANGRALLGACKELLALKLHQFTQQVLSHGVINQFGTWIQGYVREHISETVLYCSDKCRAGTPKPR